MQESKKTIRAKGHGQPPHEFPDVATCCVGHLGIADYYECLSPWMARCPHNISDGKKKYCRHDTRFDILARSTSGNPPPSQPRA